MNDSNTKQIIWIVVAAIAVIVAGFSVYKSVGPAREESIGTLPITKEGGLPGGQQPPLPGKQSETASPDGGDVLSGAPAGAEQAGRGGL